jgi:hypothetical protein
MAAVAAITLASTSSMSPIDCDKDGVLRYRDSQQEVALYGVNYMTPFAYSFRTLKENGISIEQTIRRDLEHLSRMGVDALRVHVWDREISDQSGNLLENDHLRAMDFMFAECKARGIYVLPTPMNFYTNGYPAPDSETPGFSGRWPKSAMGSNPEAIAASARYVAQFVNHVNPYTGLAYKDDPSIFGFELCNEPEEPPLAQLKSYIETLSEAIRATGSRKPIFYCATQSAYREHADVLKESSLEGVTFGWYPTGLVAGRSLSGNFLPLVETYPFLDDPAFERKAKVVYEYDVADIDGAYLHPAVAQTFRRGGVQWATQFHYCPLPLSRENTPYPTHNLNLVTSPAKAISFLIASRVFHSTPRRAAKANGLKIDPARDLSQFSTATEFIYSNSTTDRPISAKNLTRVAGVGDSPVVRYEGPGAYFLDRRADGTWKLEVFPDAFRHEDRYSRPRQDRPIVDILSRAWTMTIRLPDLGSKFHFQDAKGTLGKAVDGTFRVKPGTYFLSKGATTKTAVSASSLDDILSSPPISRAVHQPAWEVPIGRSVTIRAEIQTSAPESVLLEVQTEVTGAGKSIPMRRVRGYSYEATIPAAWVKGNNLRYRIRTAENAGDPLSESIPNWLAQSLVVRNQPKSVAVTAGAAADDLLIRARSLTETTTSLSLRLESSAGEGIRFDVPLTRDWRTIRVSPEDLRPAKGWVLLRMPDFAKFKTLTATASGSQLGIVGALPVGAEVEVISAAPASTGYTVPIRSATEPAVLFDATRDSGRLASAWPPRFRGFIGPVPGEDATELAQAIVVHQFGWPRHASWRQMVDRLPLRESDGNQLQIRAKSLYPKPVTVQVVVIDREGRAWGTDVTVGPQYETIKIPLTSLRPISPYRVPYSYPGGINLNVPAGDPDHRPKSAPDIQSIQVGVVDESSQIKGSVGLAVAKIWVTN